MSHLSCGPHATTGPGITAERDRYAAQLAVITVALRDIAGAYDTGTMAHDVAHAALEALGDTRRTRSAADPAAALREIDAICREDTPFGRHRRRIASIARGALGSAADTIPAPPLELAAAMAETRQLRELVREICDKLVSQNYPVRKVAPWLKRAGLES